MANEKIEFIIEESTRTGFISVIEPRAFVDKKFPNKKAEPKYQCQFLLEPDSGKHKELKKLCFRAARDMWPRMDIEEAVKLGKLRMPYKTHDENEKAKKERIEKDGSEYVPYENSYSEGKIIVSATTTSAPALAYFDGRKIIDLSTPTSIQMNKAKFYSGVDAMASFNIVAQSGGNDDFVTLYLQQFVALDTGKPIVSRRPASATFSAYLGKIKHVDPMIGADDDY